MGTLSREATIFVWNSVRVFRANMVISVVIRIMSKYHLKWDLRWGQFMKTTHNISLLTLTRQKSRRQNLRKHNLKKKNVFFFFFLS